MPSPLTTVWFLIVLFYVCLCFVVAAHRSARNTGANTTLWTLAAIVGVAIWARLTATVQLAGVLNANANTIPLVLYFGISLGLAIALAVSPVGRTFAASLPVAWLILFQAFRLPLELIVHAWYLSGTLPVQMTWTGHNYDIVTGLMALALGLWAWRSPPPRALIWGFEVIGTGLLLVATSIAILSSATPFLQFIDEPAVRLAQYFPYGWIIPFGPGAALFWHLILLRWLLQTRVVGRKERDRYSHPRTTGNPHTGMGSASTRYDGHSTATRRHGPIPGTII